MDEKVKRICPNCSQLYSLKVQQNCINGNLPMFLSCGHTMCQNCIKNIVKFLEPIECKICSVNMELPVEDVVSLNENKIKISQLFPVNFQMVGELTLDLMEKPSHNETHEKQYYIDLKSIMKGDGSTKGTCIECNSQTTKMCEQCNKALCEHCFNKSHKTFIIFQSHVLQNIDTVMMASTCKIHNGKSLDYYCEDCKKSVCMDCMMVGGEKSCKNHSVVSMQEVNEKFLEELNGLTPKVNETFKRLTKTAVDIGNLLYNIDGESGSETELQQIISDIDQHFSKLCSIVQKHKQEVIGIVTKLKSSEKESLLKARNDVYQAMRNTKKVLDLINSTANDKMLKKTNLANLVEDAKKAIETPWYLSCEKVKGDSLKVAVNEDICALISDYIHLEGNANSTYKLTSTSELGSDFEIPPPPQLPVYPPELPRDVRQKLLHGLKVHKPKEESKDSHKQTAFYQVAPSYRSKSISNNSLNSIDSDSSRRSYIQTDGYHQKPMQHVQPFAESQHPRQLKEGSQEVIYVSHIVDPHDFYVQRACHQNIVKELLREFRNAKSLPKPSINHIAEGKTYLAYNSADDLWLRCRVISIERNEPQQPRFKVFFFDFGSISTVNVEKLRLIPPARLQSPYPLAISCSLANCEPISGNWTSDDSFLIQKIIDNKQAVIYVRSIKILPNYTEKLVCDLTTFEDGVNIAQALVFHERAKLVNPKIMYLSSQGAREKPKIFVNNNDYKPKMIEEVYITHVVSPDKFYVRKRHLQKIYEKLSEDLEAEYNINLQSGSVYLPEVGMVYVVNVEKYGESAAAGAGGSAGAGGVRWARCSVAEVAARGQLRLRLLDSGRELTAHFSALRHIRPKFTTQRALATECHLAGITPLNKKWKLASVNLLWQYADKVLELHVEEANARGSLAVTLYDRSDDDDQHELCLNRLMVKHKYAVSIGVFDFNKEIKSEAKRLVVQQRNPLEQTKTHNKPTPEIRIQKKEPQIQTNREDLEAKDKGPLRLEAKVLQYQSPSLIYVALVHQEKTFKDLFEKMQKYYAKKPKNTEKVEWKVGDRCCTLCFQSQTWRRATIVEIENENAKVFYSDFACVETVPLKNLVDLTAEFASIGDAAIKCHLTGVIPAVGEKWPSLTTEYLKDLLEAYKRIFITKLGDFKEKSMPIEVWVYHTEQGEALEPNKCEWRCLNKKIIEQGLGIPDKSQIVENPSGTEDNDMLSFFNVTGSVQEWLQLEPLPMKPFSLQPELKEKSSSPQNEDEAELSNVTFITDWLPPEPFTIKEFTAIPTYVDNDGIIYLHDDTQQETLDLIRKALDVRFKAPDPKSKYVKWNIGEPCVAMYYLDNKFYRGRILEVDESKYTCLVHYIDYGNDEICSFENIRKSIVLHQIPTQAHKCVLDRIKPIGKNWDRQTLDYLHKTVVEKHCFVKVKGDTVNGITPIELKYNKLWIHNHLVEFEMAKFVDGSKAQIAKFVPTIKSDEEVTISNNSEPDYIVEEDSFDQSNDSVEITPPKHTNWNQLMENDDSDDESSLNESFITYPETIEDEFKCIISVINDMKTVELTVIQDDETQSLYEEMYKEIRSEAEQMPPLNGIFANKACIAKFNEDHEWYRANILEYSEDKGQIRVRYVDYGNTEVISLADAREISEEWSKLSPATITAKLHGITVNTEIDRNTLAKEVSFTFLEKDPFNAIVINKDGPLPSVKLLNANNELVYQHLIDKGIYFVDDSE